MSGKGAAAEKARWLKAVGRAVRELRAQRGLSQEALGFRSDLTQTYISQVEVGNRNPSVWALHGIARGLGVTPSELLAIAERAPK